MTPVKYFVLEHNLKVKRTYILEFLTMLEAAVFNGVN